MTDERIKAGYEKVRSEFMLIVYFAALASFLIKTFVYGPNFGRNLFEFVILISYPVFQAIRAHQLGLAIKMDKDKTRNSFLTLIIVFTFLIAYSVYRIISTGMDIEKALEVVSFLAAYIAAVTIIRILFIKLENKRFNNLGKKYDD